MSAFDDDRRAWARWAAVRLVSEAFMRRNERFQAASQAGREFLGGVVTVRRVKAARHINVHDWMSLPVVLTTRRSVIAFPSTGPSTMPPCRSIKNRRA